MMVETIKRTISKENASVGRAIVGSIKSGTAIAASNVDQAKNMHEKTDNNDSVLVNDFIVIMTYDMTGGVK